MDNTGSNISPVQDYNLNQPAAKKPSSKLSPLNIAIITALTVFVAEAVVMGVIYLLPPFHSVLIEAVFDSSLLTILLLPAFYFFLFRPLVAIVKDRIKAEEELRKSRNMLDEIVHERTEELMIANRQLNQNFDLQNVINSLLILSLKDISLKEILERALDLILSVKWLVFQGRGCIFVVKEDEPGILNMVAQRGLSQFILNSCHNVPFGKCYCGNAALKKEVHFSERLDERHETSYAGIIPHGHYCVPILYENQTIGVINVYVKEGHKRDKTEEDFLAAVANTLAGIIMRKRGEEELLKHRDHLEELVKNRTVEIESLNSKLVVLAEEAASVSKFKSEFIAYLNHELRTPLNSVLGFAQVLEAEYFGEMNEKQKEYVKDILDSGKLLLALINDILDMSKIEAGSMEFNAAKINLEDILENGKILFKEKAMTHSIKFAVNISPGMPAEIETDERKFRQVLFNLLSNAFKYTPDGGEVTIGAAKVSENEAVISVTDSGPGVSKEDQEKIFIPFRKLDPTKHGTGLGLSLSKKMVELWNGKIGVESPPAGREKGSRFYFTVPLR